MKILFTGASSFTGYWFCQALAAAGHEVVILMRREVSKYPDELRRTRAALLAKICRPVREVAFGDDGFLDLIKRGGFDVFCHHAADVTNYRSSDFDVTAAVQNNTHRLPLVLDLLKEFGCNKIVVTGSVFENDEGCGTGTLEAFSPYGLSKGLTWQIFRYYTQSRGMDLGKFVIPNPFGPYEEPRFTHYLVKNWFAGAAPTINTPLYVRDNIHVSLLAKVYVQFVESLTNGVCRIGPSGYIESQGAFTHRFANAMRVRLGLKCEFLLREQTDFSEPRIRINLDVPNTKVLNWNEQSAWDELAEYYEKLMAHH